MGYLQNQLWPNPISPSEKLKPRPLLQASSINPSPCCCCRHQDLLFSSSNAHSPLKMAKDTMPRPWFLDLVPLMVVLLAVGHVLALAYWIYRLATEKQPQRNKRQ